MLCFACYHTFFASFVSFLYSRSMLLGMSASLGYFWSSSSLINPINPRVHLHG